MPKLEYRFAETSYWTFSFDEERLPPHQQRLVLEVNGKVVVVDISPPWQKGEDSWISRDRMVEVTHACRSQDPRVVADYVGGLVAKRFAGFTAPVRP